MNFGKLIMWIANAFFWGVGIFVASVILTGMFAYFKEESVFVMLIGGTIFGGIIMHVYHIAFNSESSYKEFYKDIFGK